MIFYTIIIPHKNTPGLLQFCLDSIPIRKDVQVIVIDDNSDPEAVDFGHFPQWRGENYEYYLTKEGKGAGYARNVGLERAKGKWVLFVDSDDFLLPSVNGIFDDEQNTEADIVFFRPKAVMLKDRLTSSNRADLYNLFIDHFQQSHNEVQLRCRYFPASSKFFKLRMIKDNGIRFDEILYSNDALFSVNAGVLASRIEARDKSFYCITESDFSLTSSFLKKPGELLTRADAFFRAQQVLLNHGYTLDEDCALFYLRKLFNDDRDSFFCCFERMLKMGYKKELLIQLLFKYNKTISRIKRTLYVFYKTTIPKGFILKDSRI